MKPKAQFLTVNFGRDVTLDNMLGEELSDQMDVKDKLPRFVLSTEKEATDRCIVRQFWDLSRLETCGIPVFDSHSRGLSIGRWVSLAVESSPERRLIGEFEWNPHELRASQRKAEWESGFLNACSVGWIPGETIRRSELPSTDPLYKEPAEDSCGFPAEGYVYGSERMPNVLLECSLTFIPADSNAVALRNAAGFLDAGLVDEKGLVRMMNVFGSSERAMELLDGFMIRRYGVNPLARKANLDVSLGDFLKKSKK